MSIIPSEAQVRAFVKSTRTRYVLGTGTRWVHRGTLGYVSNKKIFLEKKLGTARVQLGTARVRI